MALSSAASALIMSTSFWMPFTSPLLQHKRNRKECKYAGRQLFPVMAYSDEWQLKEHWQSTAYSTQVSRVASTCNDGAPCGKYSLDNVPRLGCPLWCYAEAAFRVTCRRQDSHIGSLKSYRTALITQRSSCLAAGGQELQVDSRAWSTERAAGTSFYNKP